MGYLVTNECLEAIISGMNLRQEDSALAICGSGDQAFAMLEKVKRILVVDDKVWQVQYFLRRKSFLESGKLGKFLKVEKYEGDLTALKLRNEYFSKERLRTIQLGLKKSKIETRVGDLFDLEFARGEFNKVYLSNVLSYGFLSNQHIQLIIGKLQKITNKLSDRGLIYLSDSRNVIERAITSGYASNEKSLLKGLGLRINQDLTLNAQRLQGRPEYWDWKIVVLEKTDK